MSSISEELTMVTGQNWATIGIRGVLAILFGVLAFAWPAITLTVLVLLFAAYAFVDGVFAFGGAYRAADNSRDIWPFLVEGILGVVAGIGAFVWPNITAIVLLYLIAAWAVVTGVIEVYTAIQVRKQITDELWLGVSGLVSVLFGILLVVMPGAGALAVIWLIAAYAIVFGVTLLGLAWRMREHHSETQPGEIGQSA
ncbi:MAG: HdeD family acid-resistance protein [Halobacteriaceae archaeon]